MLKWFSISLFIGLILFKPVVQLSWEIWYAVNLEYVAEELCENQDEPELKCDGKCYLNKQLAATEVEEKDEVPSKEKPSNPYQFKEVPFALLCSAPEPVTFDLFNQEKQLFAEVNGTLNSFNPDFFHPPPFLS
ncbi:MAG: hypothetical protein ACJA1C_002942 [Crocinitomicaceae bacterium]|jgi:hypothetical protein